MSEKDKKQTISSLHSMKTQFLIVVLIVTAISVTLYTVLIMPRVKDNIRNIYSQYLQEDRFNLNDAGRALIAKRIAEFIG